MPLVLLRRTALAVALGVLIQQFAIADSTGGAQVLDLSSPESALRSYWAIKDRRPHPNHSQDSETTAFLKDMAMVTAGETQKYFLAWEPSPPYRVSRTIKSTSEEGPSRVVLLVNVKNISTVPAGVTPTATELTIRESGQDYRYVVEKQTDGWRILEVWRLGIAGLPSRPYNVYQQSPARSFPSSVYDD